MDSWSPIYRQNKKLTYLCSHCGIQTGARTEKSIIQCPVCGVMLCKNCSYCNFCEKHWDALPDGLKEAMKNIDDQARQKELPIKKNY